MVRGHDGRGAGGSRRQGVGEGEAGVDEVPDAHGAGGVDGVAVRGDASSVRNGRGGDEEEGRGAGEGGAECFGGAIVVAARPDVEVEVDVGGGETGRVAEGEDQAGGRDVECVEEVVQDQGAEAACCGRYADFIVCRGGGGHSHSMC